MINIILLLVSFLIIFILTGYIIYYFYIKSMFMETLYQHGVEKFEAKRMWRKSRWYLMKKSLEFMIRRNK